MLIAPGGVHELLGLQELIPVLEGVSRFVHLAGDIRRRRGLQRLDEIERLEAFHVVHFRFDSALHCRQERSRVVSERNQEQLNMLRRIDRNGIRRRIPIDRDHRRRVLRLRQRSPLRVMNVEVLLLEGVMQPGIAG